MGQTALGRGNSRFKGPQVESSQAVGRMERGPRVTGSQESRGEVTIGTSSARGRAKSWIPH